MKPLPLITDGIGYCRETCPARDGKRCRLTGFQPDGICEPWLRELVQERDELSAERERVANLLIAEEEENEALKSEARNADQDYQKLLDEVKFLKTVLRTGDQL